MQICISRISRTIKHLSWHEYAHQRYNHVILSFDYVADGENTERKWLIFRAMQPSTHLLAKEIHGIATSKMHLNSFDVLRTRKIHGTTHQQAHTSIYFFVIVCYYELQADDFIYIFFFARYQIITCQHFGVMDVCSSVGPRSSAHCH